MLLNPLLQVPRGDQDAFGLGSGSVPLLAEAVGECLLLLCGLQLCPQKSMAYADLLGIERFDHRRDKLRQADTRGTVRGDLPTFAAICSMLYFGSSKLSRALNPCASSSGGGQRIARSCRNH
jgi:hypothetical protein